jgi:hypothetical protein
MEESNKTALTLPCGVSGILFIDLETLQHKRSIAQWFWREQHFSVRQEGEHTATYKISEEFLTTQAHSSECKNQFFRNIAAGSFVKCK